MKPILVTKKETLYIIDVNDLRTGLVKERNPRYRNWTPSAPMHI